jgi:hypothetical protein
VLLASWKVSSLWRATVKDILTSKTGFSVHHPCGPVEYGQIIDLDTVWLESSSAELSAFVATYDQLFRANQDQKTWKWVYPSARLSQSSEFPDSMRHALSAYVKQSHPNHPFVPNGRYSWIRPDTPDYNGPSQWLD